MDKVQSIIHGPKRHMGLPLVDGDSAHFEPSQSLEAALWLLIEICRFLSLDGGLQRALRSSYRQFDLVVSVVSSDFWSRWRAFNCTKCTSSHTGCLLRP